MRRRAKLELTATAVWHKAARSPVAGGVAHRVHDRRQGSHRVAVNAAIALHLNLPLDAAQHVGHALYVVHALGRLAKTSNHHRVVLVSVHQLKLGVGLNVAHLGRKLAVEHRAIDALGIVDWVNQTLVAIDHLNQFVRLVNNVIPQQGLPRVVLLTNGVHVNALVVLNNVVHPLLVPALSGNLVL